MKASAPQAAQEFANANAVQSSRRTISDDPARLLSVEEVAALLGMSTAWVRQHANGLRRPTIPSVKLGKSVRFRRDRVMQFIEAMERCA
jgi:excisionase family DNA binding protein